MENIINEFRNLSPEEKAKTAAIIMSTLVNTFNDRDAINGFVATMNSEHRTLQQTFTKLTLKWIENVASNEYRTDGRNEDSKTYARELINKFRESNDNFSPSDFLRFI